MTAGRGRIYAEDMMGMLRKEYDMDLFTELLLRILFRLGFGPMLSVIRAVGSLFMPDSHEAAQTGIGCLMLLAVLAIGGFFFWVTNTPFRFS
ncbi:MAG: hypothetical protein IPK19_01255 [Chloroflexi bacterium]|nr:hypothetical protein [Chloroflexota bacterium]